jgi:hypothetical protein
MKKTSKKTKTNKIVEYVGWIGFAILLLNYILLSTGLFKGDTVPYHIFALVGTACIGYEAISKKDRQAGYLNLIFAIVAVFAITRIITI